MKFTARFDDAGRLSRRLTKLASDIAPAATDAAAGALAEVLQHAREDAGLSAPLLRGASGRNRSVGMNDDASLTREFGTFDTDPTPWLAPSLPAARRPMRAAAATAVARALSALAHAQGNA